MKAESKMNCRINGIGWVNSSGLGTGICSDWASTPQFPDGELKPVQRKDVFSTADRSFGRMDHFSRLGLAGIALTLRDAGLEQWQEKRVVGILAETASGCLFTDADYFDSVVDGAGQFASPQLFAYTLPNTFLGEAALRFGLTGNCQVVNAAEVDDSGLAVVRMAMQSLAWGEEQQVIVGYCDLTNKGALRAPGALFMLLERCAVGQDNRASILELDGDGKLSCAGKLTSNLQNLLEELAAQ